MLRIAPNIERKIILTDIRKRVNELCKKKGINRKLLFNEIHLEEHYLDNCMSRDYIPNTQSLVSISEYFGTSVDYLLYGTIINDDEGALNTIKEITKELSETHKALEYACLRLLSLEIKIEELQYGDECQLEGEEEAMARSIARRTQARELAKKFVEERKHI